MRWPRLLGAILLAAAAQAGLGARAVGGGPVAAYLGGAAAVAGVVGALLLAQPLRSPARWSVGALLWSRRQKGES